MHGMLLLWSDTEVLRLINMLLFGTLHLMGIMERQRLYITQARIPHFNLAHQDLFFIVTVLRMGLYMKLLKKRTIILALTLAAVFMLIGCSNTAQPQISGKLLFEIDNCDSIELQIGSSEYKAKKQKEIDNISALMTSLTLKKVNIDDLEGGISVIVNTPDKKAVINVCGKNILYNNQWYEATEDISDRLRQFFD